MKIAFPVFYKDTHNHKTTGVWGDEIMAKSCCKVFRDLGHDADVYIKEEIEGKKFDVCIYTNYQLIHPMKLKEISDYNVLWIQGFTYDSGHIIPLDQLYEWCKPYFNLIVTSSRVLADKVGIPFVLPFNGCEDFHKVESDRNYDVSFIGNILKPFETNTRYLRPLADFKYGLFGGDFGKVNHPDALKIISGSKVNLSFGFKESVEWDMVIARPFYHCLCESTTLMDKVPWYMETFGKFIGFTEGGDDEVSQLKSLVKNEEMRKSMARESFRISKSIKNDNLLKLIQGV